MYQNYNTTHNKKCVKNGLHAITGQYETLAEAQEACAADVNCETLHDIGCSRSAVFLCSSGGEEINETSDCLYVKDNYGNYSLLRNIIVKP